MPGLFQNLIAIDCHKSILAKIPDAIQQEKWELLAKVRTG